MSHGAQRFTADEIIEFLDTNYDIPGDGERSEVDSDEEALPSDEESSDLGKEEAGNIDNIHNLDITDEDDSQSNEPPAARGRFPTYDFSSAWWVEDRDLPSMGKFTQDVGPTRVLPKGATARDFFQLFFTNVILMNILRETTKYAHQKLRAQGKPINNWQVVTQEEFMAWLGILLAMGFHRLPSMRDYWSTEWVLGTPDIVKAMTRNPKVLPHK